MPDQDALNMQIRKFLKQVGVTSQREIEQALQRALAEGQIQGGEQLKLRMTLEVDDLSLRHTIDGRLDLGAS